VRFDASKARFLNSSTTTSYQSFSMPLRPILSEKRLICYVATGIELRGIWITIGTSFLPR
jgi:hypothetical protein